MTHRWRFPLILLLSIVFGAPVLTEMAMASGDLASAGVRYLAALGLSWMGVTAIARIMDNYAAHNDHERRAEAAESLLQEPATAEGGYADEAVDRESEGAAEPAMS